MEQRIALSNTTGRGRNGWFEAREAVVENHEARVYLDVLSRRPSYPGPIHVELAMEDAGALGRGLLHAAGQPQAETLTEGFANVPDAVAALDYFLARLSASPWLEAGELDAIRRETVTSREMLVLSDEQRRAP